MKLLNSFVSPFAARVRLAIYASDLPVEIAPSGQWTPSYEKSPAYLAINPTGRVPTLVLDDGSALPESGMIVEYLADAFPASGLRPRGAQAIAKARLLAHLMEHYVQIPANPLTPQLFMDKPDLKLIESRVAQMDVGLGYLDHFMGHHDRAADQAITIADCALVPFLYFHADRMVEALGQRPIINKHPNVAAYWREVQAVPAAQRLLDEMKSAIADSRMKKLVLFAA